MSYSIGDVIKIKESGEEATVIAVINAKIIEVETDYGEEITLSIKDIIRPDKTVKQASEDSTPQPFATTTTTPTNSNKASQQIQPTENGFYFSFHPVTDSLNEEVFSIKIFFINHTDILLNFQYHSALAESESEILKAIVQPFSEIFLEDIEFAAFNGRPKFFYNISPTNPDWLDNNWFQFNNSINLSPKKLFSYLNEMKSLNKTSFETLIEKLMLKKTESPKKKTSVIKKDKIIQPSQNKKTNKIKDVITNGTIDLHAEALGIDIVGRSNFDILSTQLDYLRKALLAAAEKGLTSLIIIHGVGNGKLKEEVHALLKAHRLVSFYQHSWRPKYGNGATEAFLK